MNYPTENQFINIHSHRKPISSDEWVLRNAFHLLDEHKISKLNYAVSAGLHPWHVTKNYEKQISSFKKIIQLNNVSALGEIGLDKAIDVDLKLQKQAFEVQLQLAAEFDKPVVIHAVKSYSDLIPYIKKFQIPFILHQYRGNIQQTAQFLKHHNVYFSFGKDLIKRAEKIVTVFKEIPLDKIFLETDVANCNIRDVYRNAAELKGISVDELKQRIHRDFIEVFKIKSSH